MKYQVHYTKIFETENTSINFYPSTKFFYFQDKIESNNIKKEKSVEEKDKVLTNTDCTVTIKVEPG